MGAAEGGPGRKARCVVPSSRGPFWYSSFFMACARQIARTLSSVRWLAFSVSLTDRVAVSPGSAAINLQTFKQFAAG